MPLSFFLLVGFLTLYLTLWNNSIVFQPMAAHWEKQTDSEKKWYECPRFFVSSTLILVPLSFFSVGWFFDVIPQWTPWNNSIVFQPMAAHLEKQTDPVKERYECLRFSVSSTLAVVW
jgi:hypothetical protein